MESANASYSIFSLRVLENWSLYLSCVCVYVSMYVYTWPYKSTCETLFPIIWKNSVREKIQFCYVSRISKIQLYDVSRIDKSQLYNVSRMDKSQLYNVSRIDKSLLHNVSRIKSVLQC